MSKDDYIRIALKTLEQLRLNGEGQRDLEKAKANLRAALNTD